TLGRTRWLQLLATERRVPFGGRGIRLVAYVVLASGHEPDAATAERILAFCRENLAPYKRIRRLEFGELPKTISGKIRRVELRGKENEAAERPSGEYRDEDFPSLKG